MNLTSSPTLTTTLLASNDVWTSPGKLEKALRERGTDDGGHRIMPGVRNIVRVDFVVIGIYAGAQVTHVPSTPTVTAICEVHNQQPVYSMAIRSMLEMTSLSKERVARLLSTTRPTLDSWLRGGQIRDQNRQRIFAIHDVLKRAAMRYRTSDQLVEWLDTPRSPDGRTPAQLLAAGEFDRARALAISMPPSRLGRTPAWVGRPVAEAFQVEVESFPEAVASEENQTIQMFNADNDEDEEWETLSKT